MLVESITGLDRGDCDFDFILGKNAGGVAAYKRYSAGRAINNVFELGIWCGGSTAFFHELFQPEKLVAIDIQPPVSALQAWIDGRRLGDRITTVYGVDQSDAQRLQQIYSDVFADTPLDLVLDDASHLLEPTRTSFNTLFPLLKPGSHYIIEDWAWAECFRNVEGLLSPALRDAEPLSTLIYEIVAASGRSPQVVSEVVVSNAFVLVRRGDAMLDLDFDIRAFG